MNILCVTDNYHPAVNGIVTQIDLLEAEFERQGHKMYIVAPSTGKPFKDKENVFRLPSLVNPARPLDRFCIPKSAKLTKLLLEKKIDVVHNHLFVAGFFGHSIAKKINAPMVATLHTPFTQYVRWTVPFLQPVAWPFLVPLYRWYFSFHDMAIAPSSRAGDELKDAGIKTPIKVLYNGIVLKVFTEATDKLFREKYHIDKNIPLAVSVGRIDPGKNVDLIIKATKIVLKEVPNLKLVIIGDGMLKKNMEELVKKENLEGSIQFTGFLDRDLIASAFKASNMTLMASDTDVLSTVMIEAMAAGNPLIAVNDKAMLPLVEQERNGFLTKKTPEDFARHMLILLKDKALAEKYGKESSAMSKNFTVEKTVNNLLQVYTELIKARQAK